MTTTTVPAQQQDITDVWIRYKQDPTNKMLRNRLVEQYLPLVKYNGERIWSRLPDGVELDDLISAGVFGLMDAIDAFDMNRGVKFETYCVPRIRGAMLDELRTMDWVPRLVRSKASKLNEAVKQLEARLGRSPNENELAEYMELSVKEFEKLITDANAVNLVSLNKKWYETDSYKDVREIDILEDKKGRGPDQTDPEVGPDAAGDQGPQPQRAAHHHPLLLRGTDDEGNRRHARPVGKPREPDAQCDRQSPAEPTRLSPSRVRYRTRTCSERNASWFFCATTSRVWRCQSSSNWETESMS
jgi:RNA polymerase sigma factor FliA